MFRILSQDGVLCGHEHHFEILKYIRKKCLETRLLGDNPRPCVTFAIEFLSAAAVAVVASSSRLVDFWLCVSMPEHISLRHVLKTRDGGIQS